MNQKKSIMAASLKFNGRSSAGKIMLLVSMVVLSLALARTSSALDDVNLHMTAGVSPNALVYRFTKDKGFYREEGLDVLQIQAGTNPGIQGLVGGSFHFSQIVGTGTNAILRGMPLKVVMVFDNRSLNWLFAGKNIKSLRDLKGGKHIAVTGIGSGLEQMTREILQKHGVDLQQDVFLRPVEPTPNRLAALMSGAVDAAVLSQTDRIIAKKNGFNELVFYGDEVEFVTGGVVVAEKTLTQKPDFVYRFLRGTLKGFHWLKTSEKEVVARMAAVMKVSESEALDVYKAWLRAISADGTVSRSLQEKMIAFQKKTLKIDREVLPETVYDFSMVRSINEALRKGG
jgi:ABC-type nitrate/sulfonate/bicarbonate transport system substrate-binding protein